MPTYKITGPDGRSFKVTGPNKEGALAALQAQLAPRDDDTSMSTAFKVGEAGTIAATKGYMADANRQMEQGPVGRFLQAGEDYIAKPIADTLGIERGSREDALAEEQARIDSEAQFAAQRRDRIINDTNYKSMTTGDVKGLGSLLKFSGQKIAESAPRMAAAIGSGGTMALPMAAGEINENLRDIKDLSEEDRVRLATGGGAISAVLENLGIKLLFKGIPNDVLGKMGVAGVSKVLEKNGLGRFSKRVAAGVATEGVTEAAQEGVSIGAESIGGREFTSEDIKSRLIEAAAAGGAAGGGIRGGASIAGGVVDSAKSKPREDTPEARAEATFAQRIQGIAAANKIDLRDVDTASTTGAREAVDKAHVQIAEDLKQTFSDLKGLVKPTDLDALELVQDKVLAQAAYREGRNKTKNVVGKQEFDALDRLTGQTLEGQRALNLLREMNVLTKIHNDGYKGGLSQYTDTANPFDTSQNTYNAAAQISGKVLGPLATATAAYSTGGTSIPIQAGVALGGRGIDKITGRRSRLNRFVKQNANNQGIEAPSGLPSIRQGRIDEAVAAQRVEEARAEKAAVDTEARKQTNRRLVQAGAPPTEGSPQDIVQVATDLDRSSVALVLRAIERTKTDPVILNAIKAYRGSVDVGGRVPDMSPLIRQIKQTAKEMGVRAPDTGTAQTAATGSPNQTNPENYQRGIDDNKAMLQDLKDGTKTDPTMSPADKAKVLEALDQLGMNLGSDPSAKVNEIMGKLKGVEPDAVAQYVEPYVMRVMGQQNAAPRMSMAPQEDTPAVDPKKPQAPRLAPEQIPTQTRKVYKLMKVQKSRPGEVLPLFAKSGGDKGPASGYTFGEWFGAENQRPKLGNKLLAQRPGIHAVNLPVFDQGKAKVKGEQRVWVEVEIPAVSPETQAESDNSPVLSNGMRTGVQDRLIAPNESYDYKTNPNASMDAGGWPVAGSMKALRIVPDTEIEQILRDNVLDRQVENSFSDVDVAKAQELMQPSTAARGADLGSVRNSAPRPEFGGKTDVSLDTSLANSFDTARGEVFQKGRDFKLVLQEKSLEAQKREGIDLTTLDDANIDRLADFVVEDALEALKDNANAIGWYDRTITKALETVGDLHPEVLTDPKAKLQLIWAVAVTSNGLKVDKNFELALDVYQSLKETGRFPTNAGIGQAAAAINSGLQQYHTMLDKFDGDHVALEQFMNSKVPVKQLEKEYRVQISGEGKNTLVRGASILGPKIGNGFYSNLYGNFDELTMDRWLMRTVGRWRGSLVSINKPMVAKKTSEIQEMLASADLKAMKPLFNGSGVSLRKKMTKSQVEDLANAIAKASMDPSWRKAINAIEGGENLRKAGNGLAKYLDGQVEAPAGAKERTFIREVFQQGLKRLQDNPQIRQGSNTELTMSDLQALLWYPEKRLYDTAKQKDGGESRGYEDDEAPDYANAARKSVQDRLERRDRLGSAGATGPGGRGPSGPNAGSTRQSVPGGILSGGANPSNNPVRSRAPEVPEVKQETALVNASIEIGKPGSEFENGIKDMAGVEKLAAAYDIALKFYNSNPEMREAVPSAAEGALGAYSPRKRTANVVSTGDLQELITALHETMHGVGVSNIATGNFLGETRTTNGLTGRPDVMGISSLESVMDFVLGKGKSDPVRREILAELKHIQERAMFSTGGVQGSIRGSKSMASMLKNAKRELEADGQIFEGQKAKVRKKLKDFQNYERSIGELTVDALQLYAHDPKTMKRVAPQTARMIRELFQKSGNKKIQFYSHPLAMVVAVVMAIMAKARMEDEEEQQLPPGMLSQQPGMLTA